LAELMRAVRIPLMDVALVPANPKKPVRRLRTCDDPPIQPFVLGTSIVTLCPDPDAADARRSGLGVGCIAASPATNCGVIARVDVRGAPLPPHQGRRKR
jgi:hypothetical protein